MTNGSRQILDDKSSGFTLNFGPPPAHADQEESPVTEEFRRLAFKGVANELEDPSDGEQNGGVDPQSVEEEAADGECDGDQNGRDAEGVAGAVDRVLVAGRVLRDPLVGGASTKHSGHDTTGRRSKVKAPCPTRDVIPNAGAFQPAEGSCLGLCRSHHSLPARSFAPPEKRLRSG